MGTRRMTNILLLSIFLCLLAMLLKSSPAQEAVAQPILPSPTPSLDKCITDNPYDRPDAYVHVVTHDVAPIQSQKSLTKEAPKQTGSGYSEY